MQKLHPYCFVYNNNEEWYFMKSLVFHFVTSMVTKTSSDLIETEGDSKYGQS